jgi:hypothetical protein
MAKKRASGKPKGLDDLGQPIDLKKDAGYSYNRARETASRLTDEFDRMRKPTVADRFEYMSDIKRNARNAKDIKLNKATERSGAGFGSRRDKYVQPIQLGKAPDKLSGRTPDAGTKSLLEGMKSFIRSGAKTAFKGVGRSGGGRPGTRL